MAACTLDLVLIFFSDSALSIGISTNTKGEFKSTRCLNYLAVSFLSFFSFSYFRSSFISSYRITSITTAQKLRSNVHLQMLVVLKSRYVAPILLNTI